MYGKLSLALCGFVTQFYVTSVAKPFLPTFSTLRYLFKEKRSKFLKLELVAWTKTRGGENLLLVPTLLSGIVDLTRLLYIMLAFFRAF